MSDFSDGPRIVALAAAGAATWATLVPALGLLAVWLAPLLTSAPQPVERLAAEEVPAG